MSECDVAIYAVLGLFYNWSPALYIIEDYKKNKKERAVFGITTNNGVPRLCNYGHGCNAFSTPVAEYALVLHKLLYTRCNIHLTFFTPLTLLQKHVHKWPPNSTVKYDKILEETKSLAEELGDKMNIDQQEYWSPIRGSLKDTKMYEREWTPMRIVVAEAEICLSKKNHDCGAARFIRTYFVPIPIRLNQASREGSKLLINRADLDITEKVASVWISAMLRSFKPKLAVLDTTHGINYVALLIERAFKRSTNTFPVGSHIRVQIYNTDPVIGKPTSQAIYKYHLIDDKPHANISLLTRSPPNLASILSEYADNKLESMRSSKALDVLASILSKAAHSFINDVILWGFILSEGAQRLAKRLALKSRNSPWLEIREEVRMKSEENIINIYQYPALNGDEGKRDHVAMRAKLQLVLSELLDLLGSINEVWEEIKERLGIRRIEIEPGCRVNTETETRDSINCLIEYLTNRASTKHGHKLYIFYCDENLGGDIYFNHFPIAAYTLLKHELDKLKESAKASYESVEHKSLDRRNFIAHAGLNYGIVTKVSKVLVQGNSYNNSLCYKIEINMQKLREALSMV